MKHHFLRYSLFFMLSMIVASINATNLEAIEKQASEEAQHRQYARAIEHYYALLDAYNNGQANILLCEAFTQAGNTCFTCGRYVDALQFYTAGIQVSEQFKQATNTELCTNGVGYIYAVFDDYERAIYYFKKGYDEAFRNKHSQIQSMACLSLIEAYCRIGDIKNAKKYLRLSRNSSLGIKEQDVFYSFYNQGIIMIAEKNYYGGIYTLRKAIEYCETAKMDAAFTVDALLALGNAYLNKHLKKQAVNTYRQLLHIADKRNLLEQESKAYSNLYHIFLSSGDKKMAEYYQQKYAKIINQAFDQQQFNKEKDKLFKYENYRSAEHEMALNRRISIQWWIIGIISLIFLCVVILATFIFYYYRKLRSAQILLVRKNQQLIEQKEQNKKLKDSIRPRETVLDQGITDILHERIDKVMNDMEIISRSDFSLQMLADITHSNTKYVSTVINDTYHKSFSTLLNETRIQEACRRLNDESNYGRLTIAAIAADVGYNSPTAFNQAFKRVTGMTPTQYKKIAKDG